MTTTTVLVGMADIHVFKGPVTYTCLGLGSCIGIGAIDVAANVSGMAHIMLPEAFADKPVDKPGKFADTGIPELLAMMERLGAQRSRIKIALAGGAQVFKFGGAAGSKLDVGARNSVAVQQQIRLLSLRTVAQDLGGNLGRTVTFCVESGDVRIRTVTGGEKVLCNLRR